MAHLARVLWLTLLISLLVASYGHADTQSQPPKRGCLARLWNAANTDLISSRWPIRTVSAIGQAFVYPFVIPFRGLAWLGLKALGRDASQVWSTKAELRKFVLFLSLFATGYTTTATELALYGRLAPAETYAHVVVVNGFDESSPSHSDPRRHFQSRYRNHPNAQIITAQSWTDLNRQLHALADSYGPITLLEIHGHGSPGQILLSAGSVDGDYLPVQTMTVNTENPVFAKKVDVALFSCKSGRGEKGEALSAKLAQWTGADEVTIHSATVDVFPAFLDAGVSEEAIKDGHTTQAARVADTLLAPVNLLYRFHRNEEGKRTLLFSLQPTQSREYRK